jgi:hypothetical protein
MSNDVNQTMDGRTDLGDNPLDTFSSVVYKVEDDDGYSGAGA